MEPDDNARVASNNKRGREGEREGMRDRERGRGRGNYGEGWNYDCILNIGAHGMNRRRIRPTLALLNVEARERQEGEDGSNIPGPFLARST